MTEKWLPVPGWESLYEVSDHGRVRSLPRQANGLRGGRILSGMPGRYRRVKLCRVGENGDRIEWQVSVHRLVLTVFAGSCPPGHHGLHGPAGRTDNSLVNLRWGTPAENAHDRMVDGTQVHTFGESHGNAKLTDTAVREIRRQRAHGEPIAVVAANFGVSKSAVSMITTGKHWRHVS